MHMVGTPFSINYSESHPFGKHPDVYRLQFLSSFVVNSSGVARGGFQRFWTNPPPPPWATALAIIARGMRFSLLKKMKRKPIEKVSHSISRVTYEYYEEDHSRPLCIQACSVGFSTFVGLDCFQWHVVKVWLYERV